MTQSEDQARAERFFPSPSDFSVRKITDPVGSGVFIAPPAPSTDVVTDDSEALD